MDQIEIIAIIGRGSYGNVLKGRHKRTGAEIAIKMMKKYAGNYVPESSWQEISIMRQLKHRNVVSLLGVVVSEAHTFVIMECVPTDLRKYLTELKTLNKKLEPEQLKSFLFQIADGIKYCHELSVMHLDIKPANILVHPEQGVIKLADFGMARSFAIPVPNASYDIVTLNYRPPELLMGATTYSWPVDIWSIGCVFAEMATQTVLFKGCTKLHMVSIIFSMLGTPIGIENWPGFTSLPPIISCFPCWTTDHLAEVVTSLDEAGMDLLRKCLRCNPNTRIPASEILKHAYFSG